LQILNQSPGHEITHILTHFINTRAVKTMFVNEAIATLFNQANWATQDLIENQTYESAKKIYGKWLECEIKKFEKEINWSQRMIKKAPVSAMKPEPSCNAVLADVDQFGWFFPTIIACSDFDAIIPIWGQSKTIGLTKGA